MNAKIAILMATYNGEKYLREQLDSIIHQTYEDIDIFICDDGSSDNTNMILLEYQEKDSRINIEYSEHLGACHNFSEMLNRHNSYEYIMFCDQDDVWDLSKVEKCYHTMKSNEIVEGVVIPTLVYCKKKYVDENLKPLEVKEYIYNDDLKTLLCQCHIYGCTMILNKALIDKIKVPDYAVMHDHWIALTAAAEGQIVKLDEALILYRQHASNVTGGLNNYSILNKIRTWKGINCLERRTFTMCYKFSLQYVGKGIICVEQYIKMLEAKGLGRVWQAMNFGYKLDHFLATVRGFYVLMSVKIK